MKIFYRRNLPHYHTPEAVYFVTFRLAGSLPQEAILCLKQEREATERQIAKITPPKQVKEEIRMWRKKYFAKFDQLLDSSSNGVYHLSDKRVANIVADAIKYRDGKEYDLYTYCIMPNHVHMVFSVKRFDKSLYKILQSLKRFTAREANKILRRTGAFWQHESYDHVVRDQEELQRIVRYVLNNPVKAGLVTDWQRWPWSYLRM